MISNLITENAFISEKTVNISSPSQGVPRSRAGALKAWLEKEAVGGPPSLSGLCHKYAHVRGKAFLAQARRERRTYPSRV
jgi:hypothetical protein